MSSSEKPLKYSWSSTDSQLLQELAIPELETVRHFEFNAPVKQIEVNENCRTEESVLQLLN